MRRTAAKGAQLIHLAGLILLVLMFSSFAIDFGYYFAAQNTMQTAADSAALAATTELYRSVETDIHTRMDDSKTQAEDLVASNQSDLVLDGDDVIFGFVDPTTKIYNSGTFRTPSSDPDYSATGGYNAVRVRVRRGTGSSNSALHTIMANMLGIHSMNTEANSVAMIDQTVNTITDGGVRPIYACEAQFNRTMEDGVPENNIVRIYGDHVEIDGVQNTSGCPAMGSGNWGFSDLRNCDPDAVGTSTMRDWFANGYPGTVTAGRCYSTDPGNFIPSIRGELDTLIADQTLFPVPLYNSWSGSGSNSSVDISGFAGFKITGYKASGSASSRYIEGHFYRYACNTGCSSDGNTGTSPGGAVVKLRLAYQS